MNRLLSHTLRRTAYAPLRTPLRVSPATVPRLFSTTHRVMSEKKESKKEEDKNDGTVLGRSPLQAFMDAIREEVRKNKDLQHNVQQLQGEASKVQDSETLKAATEAYEKMKVWASINSNPRLRALADKAVGVGANVSEAVDQVIRESGVSRVLKATGDAVFKASEPLRNTETYKVFAKEIGESFDNAVNNVTHGGYISKADRKRRRLERLQKMGINTAGRAPIVENEDAGEAMMLHETANAEKVSRLSRVTPEPIKRVLNKISTSYQESENPFVIGFRGLTSGMGRFFDETETAKIVRWAKSMDPSFTMERFTVELREYIVPEIVDAIVEADKEALAEWCSEAPYNVITHIMEPYFKPGMLNESIVLDIRDVDIVKSVILDNNEHVFVLRWFTQEIHCLVDAKTGEVVDGDPNKILAVGYTAVVTRFYEEMNNPLTGGWKATELLRRVM